MSSLTDEAALQAAIAADPFNVELRLVYADWLEERGDRRAEEQRQAVRFRLPIHAEEIRRLAHIAAARASAHPNEVEVLADAAVLHPEWRHTEEAVERLREDLKMLDRAAIVRNFPRDDDGRLTLGVVIPLASYSPTRHSTVERDVWLTAVAPERRRDPQVIQVKLESLIGENHRHHWQHVRSYWDLRHRGRPTMASSIAAQADLAYVTGPTRSARLGEFAKLARERELSAGEKIAYCTALQDDGQFEAAFELFGIRLVRSLRRMLNGEGNVLTGGRVDPTKSDLDAAAKLRRTLWEAAPWGFATALQAEQLRLDAWRAEKSGRSRKAAELRLMIVPGAWGVRRPIVTTFEGREGLALEVVFTGSNAITPLAHWQRPLELDLERWAPYFASLPPDRRRRSPRGK